MSRPKLTAIGGGLQVPDAVRIHVRKALEAERAYTDAVNDKVREVEAAGGRVIGGGQIDGDEWEITDWRTGERIAHGHSGADGLDDVLSRLDPDGKWWHVDRLYDDILLGDVSPTEGVPPSLATALEDWVTSGPSDEVAEIAGWPVGEVERVTK
jgi:hypothetical protein